MDGGLAGDGRATAALTLWRERAGSLYRRRRDGV